MNENYIQGFVAKCAEAGLDPEQMAKAALSAGTLARYVSKTMSKHPDITTHMGMPAIAQRLLKSTDQPAMFNQAKTLEHYMATKPKSLLRADAMNLGKRWKLDNMAAEKSNKPTTVHLTGKPKDTVSDEARSTLSRTVNKQFPRKNVPQSIEGDTMVPSPDKPGTIKLRPTSEGALAHHEDRMGYNLKPRQPFGGMYA